MSASDLDRKWLGNLENNVRKIEQEIDSIAKDIKDVKKDAESNYDDIGDILKYLRKKDPQDFMPGGQIRPEFLHG